MKKTETLKKNYEFKQVLAKGKKYYGRFLTVCVLKETSCNSKIGIAVSKKAGKAVKRNKIKRWIRESYAKLEDKTNDKYRIVFLLNKNFNIENASYKALNEDIELIFKKAGII